MSLVNAEKALTSELATLFPDVAIEFENAPVSPAPKAKWIQVFFLASKPSVATLGDSGEDRVNGILQLTIHYPLGKGKSEYNSDYEDARTRYVNSTRGVFSYSGQAVQVYAVDKNGTRQAVGDCLGFISINWTAFIPR